MKVFYWIAVHDKKKRKKALLSLSIAGNTPALTQIKSPSCFFVWKKNNFPISNLKATMLSENYPWDPFLNI